VRFGGHLADSEQDRLIGTLQIEQHEIRLVLTKKRKPLYSLARLEHINPSFCIA